MADNVGDVAEVVSTTTDTTTADATPAENTTTTDTVSENNTTTATSDSTTTVVENKETNEKPADEVAQQPTTTTTTHLEQTTTSEVKKNDVIPEKVSYKSLSDQLGKIDLKKSDDDVTRLLKKETETVEKVFKQEKIEDDLDREIAARMQAFSSGHKPSYSFLSSDSYLPKQTSSSFSSSSFYPSSAFVSESGVNSVKGIYESRIRDLEGDLENERVARANTERQKLDLQRDLTSCKDKLDEARLNFNKQLELIRRREQQLQNVSKQLEDSQSQAELQMTSFKKKHQDAMNELMDQVDDLHKQRQKSEKEKLELQKELAELKKKADESHSSKISLEKQNKALDDQLRELHGTINAMQKEFVEIQTQKGKQSSEAGDLRRKVIEGDTKLSDLTSLLDASHQLQNELTTRVKELEEQLVSKNEELKVYKEEVSKLKGQVDDEKERQNELQKRLTKAINDVTTWQLKCQGNEGLVHPNEVEELKKKFVQKLQESEMKLDATIGKMVALEKARSQSQALSNGLREEIEKLQNDLNLNDKKHKQHDKVVEEWKSKVDDVLKQVEEANKEARGAAEKTVKCQQQLEEANEVVERMRRENKNLKVELDDINQQLEFANQKAANSDKLAKEAEAERQEMIGLVNQKDLALQKEAAKFQRLQAEMTSEKEVLERKLGDKDVEIEALKKSHSQSLANLTLSMEDETRSKLDSLKVTKHLEQTINDLEVEVANLKKMLQEEDKVHKKYQNQLADMQALLEDEEHLRKKLEDDHGLNLERSSQWKDEADVLRLQVESLERNRKMLEGEVKDNVAKINELNSNCNALTEAKKKLEASVHHCKADNEDQQLNVRRLEDSLRKAHQDVDRLAEDLKKEKKSFLESDKLRRSLEQQLKEIATRIDSSDSTTGKLAWTRLEERINDLERDLEAERSKVNEKEKEQRKQERRVQEMDLHLVEQQDLQLKLGELCEKMQMKIRGYKKHLDEAEQLSELNLSKFRKLQSGLEEAETRANVAEKLVEELRSRAVSSVTEDVERVRKVKIEE